MESTEFSCIVLNWLSKISEFFTILQKELGPTGYKMKTLLFEDFSL